jgi:hypothetical protein
MGRAGVHNAEFAPRLLQLVANGEMSRMRKIKVASPFWATRITSVP